MPKALTKEFLTQRKPIPAISELAIANSQLLLPLLLHNAVNPPML